MLVARAKIEAVLSVVEPARLVLRRQPFSHPDWLFELKYDGFRSLAYINDGQATLISRKGFTYKRFDDLCNHLASVLRFREAILDGEIVCVDREGRPRFYDLMFRGGEPRYAVFDILYKDGKDLRSLPLRKRKQILRRLIPEKHTHLLYVDRILDNGNGLFQKICDIDL